MATAAIENTIENSQVTEDESGLIVRESWIVTGLDPTSRSPLYDALQATGLPAYGDGHEYIDGITVSSRVPRAFAGKSRTDAKVELTWRAASNNFTPTDPPRVSYTAFTQEVQTNYDRDRNPIWVRWRPPVSGGGTGETFWQKAIVNESKAMGTLCFDFIVSTNPSYLKAAHNRISSEPWWEEAAYCWHFADLNIEKVAYQPWFRVRAGFILNRDTHIPTAFYLDNDGNVPRDIDLPIDITVPEGDTMYGWYNPQLKDEFDFGTLGLPEDFV